MNRTTSKEIIGLRQIIEMLESTLSYFGLPTSICTDNGRIYGCFKILEFCDKLDIKVIKSPPYHPQSNGIAERTDQTAKKLHTKFWIDTYSNHLSDKIKRFLFYYPCQSYLLILNPNRQ